MVVKVMSVFLMEHKFATVRLVVRATHLLITILFLQNHL